MQQPLKDRSGEFVQFWTERHLCLLSTVRKDGSVHVVMVGATVDFAAGVARVICSGNSHKARQIRDAGAEGAAVAVSQTDGPKWSTLEGRAVVSDNPDRVADAVRRYADRYRQPRENPERVVIEITVTKVLGNA
ncbi:TIGR03618 family F420-dependent PPOX class oxidoreductase [Kribbella sp. VKM Ac-2568]|uniref:TIGR03618 family F420-dependent PPOX class oxidoreductase n=1 Tax=Kribbella sp. VKM Ac-2568 TaxID=2512219 RepID=UPI0010451907|nr:TIGR03618 family F420-dependent PPOX class oxidoreductase [Kribbella sp. VKM Ac-2568]TCM48263.1 PPOX class probable F420-dependent enzyme [Kribbella sp. VKM Ac-2568]